LLKRVRELESGQAMTAIGRRLMFAEAQRPRGQETLKNGFGRWKKGWPCCGPTKPG
jgi:hypothetical protein